METTDPASPWYPYVWVDPERMGGEPCFRDSRVPITALFDYLEAGDTIDVFLADFPPITREQVEAVIRIAGEQARKATAA
jgi:uncharacterized protein (DUF433 family)